MLICFDACVCYRFCLGGYDCLLVLSAFGFLLLWFIIWWRLLFGWLCLFLLTFRGVSDLVL